jgi:hypothetical protein
MIEVTGWQPEHLRLQRASCQDSPISGRMTLCFDFDPFHGVPTNRIPVEFHWIKLRL